MPGDAPRVRFAPSPTGFFHVGSARTALFNWLVARQSGGTFVLRIEDTDAERNREEWVDGILSALHWLGMDPDEGPYRQSERSGRYGEAVDALWAAGALYACTCTRDEIDVRNAAAGIKTPGYDGYCRDRGLPRGNGAALRFRTPDEGSTVVDDEIRGRVEFPSSAMDDFVVVKATGAPLFVLANVVDDIDMAITHAIRGEDLLPTTPKGILVWEALRGLGWETDSLVGPPGPAPGLPVFAHLPMLVNEQRKKLSKRRDPVSVESYRDRGYLADAFVNYLGLLGWSPGGDVERFSRNQMVERFRLSDVNHAPAFFDVAKLTHLNGEYLRDLPVDAFIEACRPWLVGGGAAGGPDAGAGAEPGAGDGGAVGVPAGTVPWPPDAFDPATFARMAPLVQERVATLGEVPAMVDFLFLGQPARDPADWAKAVEGDEAAGAILSDAVDTFGALDGGWTADALHAATLAIAERAGRKLGKAQAPIRVAVTGRRVGPPLFESLEALGPERTLGRLRAALDARAAAGS